MTIENADVDVLIPAYNSEGTIRDAISSILEQTLLSIRVVVVDDGSTDRTFEILEDLKAFDPRIAIIKKENGGIVDALNLGLSECSARYLARFDADDISYAHRLQSQVDYLEEHPECIAVAGRVDHIDAKGDPLHGLPHPGSPELANMDWASAIEPYLIHPFLMVRRQALVDVGGYRDVPNSEDSDLYWRLSEHGKLHNLDVVLGKYRFHPLSISSSSIVNSRIMAIGSQLAAISAQRRRQGLADLTFEKSTHQAYKKAGTLEGMFRIASSDLSPDERRHLRIAASIKLLELAGYRPINLEISDCQFIRGSLQYDTALTDENKKEIDWYVTTTASRLFREGRYRTAVSLLPITDYPMALARLLRGR